MIEANSGLGAKTYNVGRLFLVFFFVGALKLTDFEMRLPFNRRNMFLNFLSFVCASFRTITYAKSLCLLRCSHCSEIQDFFFI